MKCSKCFIDKSNSEFYANRQTRQCKACVNKDSSDLQKKKRLIARLARELYRQENPNEFLPRCNKCKVLKTEHNSYVGRSACKECTLEMTKIWRAKNPESPEKKRQNAEKRKPVSIEKEREYRQRQIEKDPDKFKERAKAYHQKYYKERREEYVRKAVEWNKQARIDLHDSYVKKALNVKNAPKELIELKRVSLQIKRLLKEKLS